MMLAGENDRLGLASKDHSRRRRLPDCTVPDAIASRRPATSEGRGALARERDLCAV